MIVKSVTGDLTGGWTMKRLLNLILCVLIGTTVLADEGLDSVAKPSQGSTPKGTVNNAPQDPFGAPVAKKQVAKKQDAKKQDDKKAVNANPRSLDPFGRDAFDADPQAEAETDPFEADPFGGPVARKPVVTRRVLAPPVLRTQKPAPQRIPSITLEDSSASRQRIEDQLGRETNFDYLDTPLKDVIDEIALRHGIPIIINISALEDFGIGTDTPVTISLQGISLRSALKLMLRELELTFIIKDEVLQITTPEEAESSMDSRFYSVSSLLPSSGDGEYLVKLITKHVKPESRDAVGGPGAITFVEHLQAIAVTQTEDVLHQIDTLLESVAKLAEHRNGR
jgi:hypothetical protein